MRAFIVGCGRVGAGLADTLARSGHEVTVMDTETEAFNRLEQDFPGRAIRGDGTDEDVLRRAGATDVDVFIALTNGDNRNILAAQLAAETFGVPRVIAKVNDPVRAQAYTSLGIATLNRTRLLVDAMATYLGLPHDPGLRGVSAATASHDDTHEHTLGAVAPGTGAVASSGGQSGGARAAGDGDGVVTGLRSDPRGTGPGIDASRAGTGMPREE